MSIIGFPSIGLNLELKHLIESYCIGKISKNEFLVEIVKFREANWKYQDNFYFTTINDFSLYDNMLDLSIMLGIIPKEYRDMEWLSQYFAMAKGEDSFEFDSTSKWFDTKYYFVVPKLSEDDTYKINPIKIIEEYSHARKLGYIPKISLIGFFTYFSLARTKANIDKSIFFDNVKDAYLRLIESLSTLDKIIYIEFSEPIFTQNEDLDSKVIKDFYNQIADYGINAIVTTFFGASNKTTKILCDTRIYGIGLDFVSGEENLHSLQDIANSGKKLYAGVVDGLSVYAMDIDSVLLLLDKISFIVPKDLINLSPSCSFLHIPYTIENENPNDLVISNYFSFAKEKIEELELLESVFKYSVTDNNRKKYEAQRQKFIRYKQSLSINDYFMRYELSNFHTQNAREFIDNFLIHTNMKTHDKISKYSQEIFDLVYKYNYSEFDIKSYISNLETLISQYIQTLDKNIETISICQDFCYTQMVEYISMQLNGIFVTKNGYIQTKGTECIKPIIIYGDISMKNMELLISFITIQSISNKACKVILPSQDGLINIAFSRNDIAINEIYNQLTLVLCQVIEECQNHSMSIEIYSH